MMRRFLCTPILFVFFVSCSGYEFTYSKDPKIKEIEKKTNYVIVGDDISIAKIKLIEELGRSGVDSVFLLNVGIEKISTPIVIEKDATVSKTEIKHSVSYSLLNEIKNCEILSKNVTTKSTYSSSSSGYSFSTDLSEEEVITKNLNNNIDEFLDYVVSFNGDLSC